MRASWVGMRGGVGVGQRDRRAARSAVTAAAAVVAAGGLAAVEVVL